MSVTLAVPLAGRAVGVDDDVPELRSGADPAAVEPAAEDQSSADARFRA